MLDLADDLKPRLIALPTNSSQALEGESDEEIHDLETYAGGPLPAVYKQFLRQLGRSAGELLRGSDYSVSKRFHLRLREHAEELLRRDQEDTRLRLVHETQTVNPPTRTPEGQPQRCPVCGNRVVIDPSQPVGDAPCPHCGCLLWFTDLGGKDRIHAFHKLTISDRSICTKAQAISSILDHLVEARALDHVD